MIPTRFSPGACTFVGFLLQPTTPQRFNIKPGASQFNVKVDIARDPAETGKAKYLHPTG
jgi:hypothetical protein